jgi:hypothetical protein
MSAPIADDGSNSEDNPEHSPYAPKWVREQPPSRWLMARHFPLGPSKNWPNECL